MRICHLRLRVNTDLGLAGTDIDFPDGLVVLRADNTMGKSTCIRSMLVALGFEAMLTTSQRDLPLPPAMKAQVDWGGGKLAKVVESEIYLEIENRNQKRVVVNRTVIGSRSTNLLTVTYGPALTQPGTSYSSDQFFVSRPGSASHELGYHHFLADFLEWQLPSVQTYEGHDRPLYLQCIFPYMVVEQTRGWANMDPPIPTQFRIKEPHKRIVEFLLDLDAYSIARKRVELEQRAGEIEREWSVAVRQVQTKLKDIGGIVKGLPSKPVTTWPPEILPGIILPQADDWIPAEKILVAHKDRLKKLVDKEIPRVSDVLESAEQELASNQQELRERESLLSRLLESLESESSELHFITQRLDKIGEDLQRNSDVRTLLNLGATTAPNIRSNKCPTCHQQIADSLAPLAAGQTVMSIDENISFLKEQRTAFLAVQRNMADVVEARERQIANLRGEIKMDRTRIRALKQTLISDARLPSIAAIETKLELQHRIDRIAETLEEFSVELSQFEELSGLWYQVQLEKQKLPKGDTSAEDEEKLGRWTDVFANQLKQYDFQSFPTGSLRISHDSYRPVHKGFDLPTNISASDFIRVIWSYLTGLLEVSRDFTTHHPGLLVFDEPKQQSTKVLSFGELLKRISRSKEFGQQVIFATSEEPAVLKQMLDGVPHTYIPFEGRIIRPLSD